MFFCLRALSLLAPAGVIAGLLWLAGQARQLTYRDDTDLVVEIPAMPGPFNPLAPGTGATREITGLIFDPLLRLDDELQIQPHLVEEWRYRHRATCHFAGGEQAAAAAAKVDGARARWPEWSLEDFILDGDMLHLISSDPGGKWVDEVSALFDPKSFAPLLHVRLRLREAVERSLRDFLSGSIEKGKLRHVDMIPGGRAADLYLQGETDLFLKELRLYYESNRNLEPEIEVIGPETTLTTLHFEMKLREDLKWHDGEPVTASDLVFTFEEMTRPGSSWPLRNAFDFVDRLERVDDFRVSALIGDYYAPALERWAKMPLLPAHRLRQSHAPADWEAFFRKPIGTGPFRMEAVERGRSVTLLSNPDYLRGQPRQPRIRYVVSGGADQHRLAVRLGRVDVYSPGFLERKKIESGELAAEIVRDVPRYQSLVAWNLDRPRFTDPKVRRALAMLVDVEELIAHVGGGQPEPWQGLFFPGSWFCQERPGPLPHDPAAARRLLEEAGWRLSEENGEPVHWLDREGQRAGFSLCYDARDPLHAEFAIRLASEWKAAGIGVALQPVDWLTLLETHLAPRNFDALLLDWELDFSRDHFAVWHSSEADPGGANFSGLRNQEIDGLLEKLRRENDRAAVIENATELQRLIRDLQPCLFLCGTGRSLALRGGAVKQSRRQPDGGWNIGPVSVGRAGLPASRPWWVRSELLESE